MKILTLVAMVGMILMASCGDPKKLQYLQGPYSDTSKNTMVIYKEPVILPGDILSITVFSDNPKASAVYNQPSVSTESGIVNSAGEAATKGAGYVVDNSGNIQFHSLGNIPAKGLTRQELGAILAKKLDSVLKNAYCQVRFNNFKVTVLGEVAHPSVFSIPSEKISVLEALGLAGDLTGYGRRDSVLIIRETDSLRKFGWIDLRNTSLFNSEYFYLHQNDVIVVHPTRNKSAVNDQILVRNIAIATSIVSTIAIVLTVLQ